MSIPSSVERQQGLAKDSSTTGELEKSHARITSHKGTSQMWLTKSHMFTCFVRYTISRDTLMCVASPVWASIVSFSPLAPRCLARHPLWLKPCMPREEVASRVHITTLSKCAALRCSLYPQNTRAPATLLVTLTAKPRDD